MTTSKTPSEILQVAGVLNAYAAATSEPNEVKGHHFVIVPEGFRNEDITALIEKAQIAPNRKRGTVQLKDVDSLIKYCTDQDAAAGAYLYADADQRTITAVFNDAGLAGKPGWRDHRATFKAEYTPEFAKWVKNNGYAMTQTDFAEFIEENFADITEPAAQTLLDMATTIQAKTDINFSSGKRLDNGQVQLQYTEVISATAGANGALEIPKEFTIGVRIFKNGEGYLVKARLKYRLNSGNVKFWYELDRVERAIESAFDGYLEKLRETSGYTVLFGSAG